MMLFHEIPQRGAAMRPETTALATRHQSWTHSHVLNATYCLGHTLRERGLSAGERVAVYLDKRPEAVAALFGITAAGGIAVPVNPALKPHQLDHIVGDCDAAGLITSSQRLNHLKQSNAVAARQSRDPLCLSVETLDWHRPDTTVGPTVATIETDPAMILYTSGSTGRPKGVTLSHRNLVAGTESVVRYLGIHSQDRILAALPLSFDYGLNQITTALYSGALAYLHEYLRPGELLRIAADQEITGLAGVPPLWNQLVDESWPDLVARRLRYITNSGGALPARTRKRLRTQLPDTDLILMYGLTEAFRSTYLPPEELERRPESMGRAIPNARVEAVRPDGTPCLPGEIGELVHGGPLVAMGYWNDAEHTHERFDFAPPQHPGLAAGSQMVWSGDLVTRDIEGYFYFHGRRDDMIKTSGYRVSPGEIEEVIEESELVREAVAFGVPHPVLGEAIVLVANAVAYADEAQLQKVCRRALPMFMVPSAIETQDAPLPRNANGKIDRARLRAEYAEHFQADE